MHYTIDASGKILGRCACEVALLLRGKNNPNFDPGKLSGIHVTVYNTDKIAVTGKKEKAKKYHRHSGYPGGFAEETLGHLMARDSRKVLSRAVSGMLPKNKLRSKFMKNLVLLKKTPSQ